MVPNQNRPPDEYIDWFDRTPTGVWVAAKSSEISDRIAMWAYGRGRRIVWLLVPRDRRSLYEWTKKRVRITWRCISALVAWSGYTPEYWLGEKPDVTTIFPYRRKPKSEAEQPQFVTDYAGPMFVDNEHGHRALALGLIPGFMQRFEDYFGLGFSKYEGRVPDWLKNAVRQWRIGKYRPSEEMLQRLCDWTQTNLRWWCTGQGGCKAPENPPPPPQKSPLANAAKPEKPKKSKVEAPAYNFFAGCNA